jgi:hypothetical protein
VRTTVDIPSPLYRQLKAKAALQGSSVKELILRGVKAELNSTLEKKAGYRVSLPLIKSKKPGSLKLTNRQINDLLFP